MSAINDFLSTVDNLIVVLLELNTVLLIGSFVVIRRNSELFFNILLENEEQDLESSVDNIIKDIDQQRDDLREEGLTEDEIRAKVQSWLYSKIHTDRFSESQYMWVNEVVNYEGGDNYAIRLIHPAFPQTEGEFLSTKTADIRGNTPYATELETAKTTGSGFQRYYFKDSRTGSDQLCDTSLYQSLGELGVLQLVADGHTPACSHQFG